MQFLSSQLECPHGSCLPFRSLWDHRVWNINTIIKKSKPTSVKATCRSISKCLKAVPTLFAFITLLCQQKHILKAEIISMNKELNIDLMHIILQECNECFFFNISTVKYSNQEYHSPRCCKSNKIFVKESPLILHQTLVSMKKQSEQNKFNVRG